MEATWEPLVDDEDSYGHFFEFPTISPAVRGRPYRYAYGACATRPTNAANSLVKFDTHGRSCKVGGWVGGEGRGGGERAGAWRGRAG